jgi:hypothetical protein
MHPLIFSHIPKTAGTSLRESLAKQFGKKQVLYDYGKEEQTTSLIIRDQVYVNDDIYCVLKNNPRVIFGHFPVKKYIKLSCLSNVITFVREPVARVISEYKHSKRHFGYQGALIEFAKLPQNRNKISRYVSTLPWSALGFIGISERYAESLQLLNKKFNLNVVNTALNVAPQNQLAQITDKQKKMLTNLNLLDCRIYNLALEAFEWRARLAETNLQFVYGGWSVNKSEGVISGFAFYENSDEGVRVTIETGRDQPFDVIANKFSSELYKHGGSRCGYVGFTLKIVTENIDLIKCYASHSMQPIPKIK